MSNYNELKLTYQGGRQETITLTANIIDYGAYEARNIVSVEVPGIVQTIGGYAFCDNNDLANIVLNEGLQRIEGQAFQHGVYTAVTIPSTVTYIGFNSFNTRDEQDYDQHTLTVTCLASTPPTLDDPEGITFGDPNLLSAIYVPEESVSAYQEAWPAYASKIQGGAPADNILTNLNIKAAYVGDVEVVKMYLGDDVVWEPEPDSCEGLTGESLCNCQGRYWWGGECHDVPDTMLTTPLTFEITSVGTGSTGTIGLRLSGDTSEVNKRRLTYYLTHEGTKTSGDLRLREAAANSAITSLITGLTVGDKIVFWGWEDQSGMSVSESAFEYFVTTAGVTAKVYGNVHSLLFSGAFYHGGPVPQTAETAAYAFYKLFQSKTGFTFGAPNELQHIVLPVPANGLQDSIYREMFYGCTNMTTAPELPALQAERSCYQNMFDGCTRLATAPALPATGLSNACYVYMFRGCTSLTTAPQLPATTLASACYEYMFDGCTSLTAAPSLPATTLEVSCYQNMFDGCTRLATAPALPATGLSNACYAEMFHGCTSLTTAPSLPATTLANSCYSSMFRGCTSLTTAPALPATTLANYCYQQMFYSCTRLNYIKCLATNISALACLYRWVSGVASTGTFVKDASMTGWTSGVSGIPNGWTIEDADV